MEITEFFNDLPHFTKYYVSAAILLGIMTSMKMWNTVHAFMSIPATLLHPWRYITSLCFRGKFGFDFLFEIYFFCILNGRLEQSYMGPRYGDYVYLIMLCYLGCFILCSAWNWGGWFLLSESFCTALTYIFCRRNPHEKIHFFFVFQVKASYFPFAMAAISLFSGKSITDNIIGIIIGHLYYYFKDVYPASKGVDYFRTPNFVRARNLAGGVPQNNGENVGNRNFRVFQGRGVRLG